MKKRPSARLIVRRLDGRIFLFKFRFRLPSGVINIFWATPGGGVDAGESYEQAAARELTEELGLTLPIGKELHRHNVDFIMPDGIAVDAEERFFLVDCEQDTFDHSRWTALEKEILVDARWWSLAELMETNDRVFPENLSEILNNLSV
jgi:8-oxo-dGTP pyrophosphatase MutT (NUDIX family)